MVLYGVTPDNQFFHLAYTIQRASYATDMTVRRLLVVLDVNRGPGAQVNYGTGRDVSDESIADAKEPLQIEWRSDSYVRVPIWK